MPKSLKQSSRKKTPRKRVVQKASIGDGLFDSSAPFSFFIRSVSIVFLIWVCYRAFVQLPEWVDEIFAKAVVFGIPTILYARNHVRSGSHQIGLEKIRFWPGLYIGLMVGGLYGFVGVLRSILHADEIMPVMLFSSSIFWRTFFLAIMTAWWESLFFFGYVLNALIDKVKYEIPAVAIATGVFLLFHLPLRLIIGGPGLLSALFLLTLFAIGQSILYLRTRSLYSIAISHAIWGMVLLLYG